MIEFGSVCSGIEAASVAWHPLGWRAAWLSEIEPFPCAVLAHHYPDTPNLGDMRELPKMIRAKLVKAPDVFTGGTPCQAFSVAGLRKSLEDDRGNLSLTFVEIADAVDDVRNAEGRDPCVIVWENVPGVLSTADNAFGCFLGALAGSGCELQPPRGRWQNAGVVLGPRRAIAWRILDAQFFGLAQRRKRVFVVASAMDGFDPGTVLLEFEGLRRDSAPRREAGEGIAPCVRAGAGNGGAAHGARSGSAKEGLIVPSVMASGQAGAEIYEDGSAPTLTCLHEAPIIAGALCAADGKDANGQHADDNKLVIAHTLRGDGFDASEDGTGRGTPLVPVAFSCKDHGADAADDLAPTLRAMGHDGSHANAGGQVAVAFAQNTRDEVRLQGGDGQISGALSADPGMKQTTYLATGFIPKAPPNSHSMGEAEKQAPTITTHQNGQGVQTGMAVRRLMPVECERLQGFPDSYTEIPWRGKTAEQCPDGPRYKALGNSWAVPVVAWLGKRIDEALRRLRGPSTN